MKRRTPLKRGKRKAKPSMASFWDAVTNHGRNECAMNDGWCQGAGTKAWPYLVDAHHFIAKRHLPDSAKTDPRNGVALCRWHHAQVENARLDCPRPPLLDEFLADHGLLESGRPDPKREAA